MLEYYSTIVVMLIIMIFQYRHYRHILAAPVVYRVMWIIAFAGLIATGNMYYKVSIQICIVFVTGYVLFCIGFRVAMAIKFRSSNNVGNYDKTAGITMVADEMISFGKVPVAEKTTLVDKVIVPDTTLGDQRLGLNIVTGICVLTGATYAVFLFKYIKFDNFYNSLLNIRRMLKDEELNIPYILTILRYFIRCSLWYFSLQLFRITKEPVYKNREGYNARADLTARILIILASSTFIVVADLSRNDILFTFLPVLFIYTLARRLPDRKSIALLMIFFIIFIVFFVWFRSFKGGTLDDDFGEEGAQRSFSHYLSGPLVGLEEKIRSGDLEYCTLSGGGAYTFSLFSALKDKICGTDDTPYVIREWRKIGPGVRINVYTVYEWTGMDWGILYALLWQFIFGLLYGALFFGAIRQSIRSMFWYSVLSYPLVMMFFEDQFLSVSQSWLILIVICYGIFFICNRAMVKIRYITAKE